MTPLPRRLLRLANAAFCAMALGGCGSGWFKSNQSAQAASVSDSKALPVSKTSAPRSTLAVLIVPGGAPRTAYISDKTSVVGGLVGSTIVGPLGGLVGSLAGSTAGGSAAASAEESASKNIDSSDVTQITAPLRLSVNFVKLLSGKLQQCGITTALYPAVPNPRPGWAATHLALPAGFKEAAAPYRFFVQTGLVDLQVRAGLMDITLEGRAQARVYDAQSLRQITRYASETGQSGSMTLDAYKTEGGAKNSELQEASERVALYLATSLAQELCANLGQLN